VTEMGRSKSYEAFGHYVRSQRKLAQLSLRQAAELARISNPYLSQIEHGLALPSITVLSALAEALHVSADTLMLRAAGVATGDATTHPPLTEDSIRHDPRLDDLQKRALLAVLAAFVGPPQGSETAPVSKKAAQIAPRTPRQRRQQTVSQRGRRAP
jgi:transcriptional regulator with XRE-family HTH domain